MRQKTLSFCYALLGQEDPNSAADMLRLNEDERWRAHRDIYERKPQTEPYEAMMLRLRPDVTLPPRE